MSKNTSKMVGSRVKERREELKMTMDELAQKLGYKSRASIARIENGENNLPLPKVQEIANALSTTPQYLMGWDSDSPADDFAELYEQLDADDRRAVKDFARFKLTDEKYRKKTAEKIS